MIKLDTMSRLLRHLMPKLNNRGHIRLNRDPDPDPNATGGTGGTGGGADTMAKIVIEGDASKGISNWNEIFAEEARKDPNIAKYKTPDELFKGIKNQVEMIGKKGVIIPTEKSGPEEREAFQIALGRPVKPEDYKIVVPEKLHPGIKVSPESTAAFAQAAHKMGFSNEQANQLNSWYLNMLSQNMVAEDKALQDAIQKADTALRADWGANYEANKKGAAELIMKIGGQEAMDAMGGVNGIGNNPVILKIFGKLSTVVSEDVMKNLGAGAGQGGGGGAMDKQKAAARLAEIQGGDKNSPYWNENDPKHQEAIDEVTSLYSILHGAGAGV